MNVYMKIKSNLQFRAVYLFFIIITLQTGVGVLSIAREVFVFAKQDSWASILIAYIAMVIIVLVMLYILKQYNYTDIFGIQIDLFGNFIGKGLGLIYILYFGGAIFTVLSSYIEIVQVFIYPTLPPFTIALLLLILVAYAVLGGIKVIVGIAFIFFLLTQLLFMLIYSPLSLMDWSHFSPMLQTSLPNLLEGARSTTFSLAGFEFIFLIFPYITDKEKARLPIILGISYSALILLITTIISIGYFSLKDLEFIRWPSLTLYKSITFSFLERIDYFAVVEWMMIIVPNNILYMWAITYGMKRLFNVSKKKTLYISVIIIFASLSFFHATTFIEHFTKVYDDVTFWLVFVYPLVLLPIVIIKKKMLKNKGSAN